SSYDEPVFTSPPAPTPPDSTPLSPPSVNAVSTAADNVTLSWTGVEGAAGYNIYRSTSIDGPFDLIDDSPFDGTSYSDIGLSATTYYYKVATVNEEGVESDHSEMFSVSIEEVATREPIPPTVTPPSEPVPSPEVTAPIESPIPSSQSGDVAAPHIPPPVGSTTTTTNVALWGTIGVVPAAATVVAVLWKKGVFRGRARLETAIAIERPAITPATEIDLMGKSIDNMSPSVARESRLFTASTFAAGKVMEPETKRESTALQSEPEPTEVKVMPMLELKSEPEPTEVKVMPMLELKSELDTQLKDYFEAIDKMQEVEVAEKYLDEPMKYADGGTRQKKKSRKQKQKAKQSRRARMQKQKSRKQSRRARMQKQKSRKQKQKAKQSRRARKR
ncbi:MAG: fibronectin type III domain-containing protein, partial [Nitrososphaerales archaeon]